MCLNGERLCWLVLVCRQSSGFILRGNRTWGKLSFLPQTIAALVLSRNASIVPLVLVLVRDNGVEYVCYTPEPWSRGISSLLSVWWEYTGVVRA